MTRSYIFLFLLPFLCLLGTSASSNCNSITEKDRCVITYAPERCVWCPEYEICVKRDCSNKSKSCPFNSRMYPRHPCSTCYDCKILLIAGLSIVSVIGVLFVIYVILYLLKRCLKSSPEEHFPLYPHPTGWDVDIEKRRLLHV